MCCPRQHNQYSPSECPPVWPSSRPGSCHVLTQKDPNTVKPLGVPTCVLQQEVQTGQDGCHALHRRQLWGHSQLGRGALRPAVQQVRYQLLLGRPAGSPRQGFCMLPWLETLALKFSKHTSTQVLQGTTVCRSPIPRY